MGRVRKSGGYRQLRSFQTATIIYDATYWFCEKFLDSRSRTVDQMVQAARSGRQNIAEGSRAGATSSNTELRLVNVARASQEELLLDYEDFIRHHRQSQWAPDSQEALAVRNVAKQNNKHWESLNDLERYDLYSPWLESDDPITRANALICLIHQANYLLDQQIEALETQFIEDGGYSEALAAKRIEHRNQHRKQVSKATRPVHNAEAYWFYAPPGTAPKQASNFSAAQITPPVRGPKNYSKTDQSDRSNLTDPTDKRKKLWQVGAQPKVQLWCRSYVSNNRQAAMARAIWKETIESQSWIADKLNLKSAANASQQIRRFAKAKDKEIEKTFRSWLKSRNAA